VDAGGLEAKLRTVRADGRWDTVAVATGQKGSDESVERVPNLQALIDLPSKLTTGAIEWLRGVANALDQAEWFYEARCILVSETAVDAFVFTMRRAEDANIWTRTSEIRDANRQRRERRPPLAAARSSRSRLTQDSEIRSREVSNIG
jgi:hypothetical protein